MKTYINLVSTMLKHIMGAICALTLIMGMTSCHSDIQCKYSDVKEVYEITNEQGHVTGWGMTYADGDDLRYADIQRTTYEQLKDGMESDQWLIFRYRHEGYASYIDRSGYHTTKLND